LRLDPNLSKNPLNILRDLTLLQQLQSMLGLVKKNKNCLELLVYIILLSEQQQVSCSWYQAAAGACEEAPVLDHVVPAAAGGTMEFAL